MADTLESLEIEVKHSASGAADELNNIATAISKIGGALTRALPKLAKLADTLSQIGNNITINDIHDSTFQKVTQSASKAAKAAESSPLSEELQEQISQAGKLEIAVHKAAKAGKDMQSAFEKGNENAAWSAREREINAAEKAAREIEKSTPKPEVETPAEIPTALPQSMRDFISSASQIDLLQAKLVSLNAAMQEAFNVGDSDKAISLRNQILQTEAALEKAEKAANGAANGVKNLAKEAKKSQPPLAGFISSLKRIAFYRMIRSIIKAITEALQEGLKNAYAFSSGITTEGHRFSTALDGMATSSLTLKNQLGSAFLALLAAIAPAINAIISLVVRLADALAQLFSAFTGSTYLKAVETPKKWGEAAGGAAKAAKEWKNQLLGFDEINRLEAPADPSGSGAGTGGLDPGAMFEDTPIAEWAMRLKEKLEPIIEDIKNIFKGLGTFLKGAFLGDWQMMSDGIAQICEGVFGILSNLVGLIAQVADFALAGIQNSVSDFLRWLEEKTGVKLGWLRDIWNDTMFKLRSYVDEMSKHVQGILKGISNFIAGVFTGDWDRAWNGVKRIFAEVWNSIAASAEYAINDMINKINPLLGLINTVSSYFGGPQFGTISLPRINYSPAGTTTTVSGGSHKTGKFASGGFPEDGLFMANHGELVGKFSNGRTAVANNEQIVEGIKQGVIEAILTAGNVDNGGNHTVTIDINGREFFRATYNDQKAVAKERGISLIANG